MLEFLKKKHFLFLCFNWKMDGEPKVPILQIYLFILKLFYLTLTYDLRIKGARKCLGYTRKGWAMYELTDALNKTTKKVLMIDVTTTVGSCADLAEEQHQN